MGEESVKGANMGVILIIFAAILALGLIIFMLARNMANEGLTNVAERLEAASASEFSDFDQKIVVGQRVLSAMNSFKGKRVSVLVCTQGLTDKVVQGFTSNTEVNTSIIGTPSANGDAKTGSGGAITTSNAVLNSTAVVTGHEGMIFAFGARPGRNADGSVNRDEKERKALPASSSGKTNDKQLTFIQYNTLLEPTNQYGTPVASGSPTRNSVIWWNDDHYVFSGGYRANDDGKTVFDMIWANTSKTGTTEVIPAAARYNANLLKDDNGVIMGVVFQQVGA